LDVAYPGHSIGFNIRGVSVKDLKRGFVCGDFRSDPPAEAEYFIAQVFKFNFSSFLIEKKKDHNIGSSQ
jgi:elongation factor 1-alpha